MSAITVAVFDARRAVAVLAHTAASDAYRDALLKAPGPVVVGHILKVAAHLLWLAVCVGTGRARR